VPVAVDRAGAVDLGSAAAAIGPLSRSSPLGSGGSIGAIGSDTAAAAVSRIGSISPVGPIAAPAPPLALATAVPARRASTSTGRSASSCRAELGHRHLAAGARELRGVEEGNRSRSRLPRTLGRYTLVRSVVGRSVVGCE
jgi:hypothetical protein